MFLFERVFGFGTYMLILLFVCFLLAKTSISCKLILRLYLVCLCIMAFLYKPYITGDLHKIYLQMDFFSQMSFSLFWDTFAIEDSLPPVARLLYWAIGKTGVNALLPTLTAFVCYSLVFYVINKTRELYSISNVNVAYVLFFIMTTSIYISTIGGIRMMLSLCFIAFSFFRGAIEKKTTIIEILLYALSALIHTMSFIVLGVCILISLFDSKRSFFRSVGYVLIMGAGVWLVIANFSDIIYGLLYEKFTYYVLGEGYSDSWEYAMGVIIIVILILSFVEFRHLIRKDDYLAVKQYTSAMVWCIVIAICFYFEFSIFYRFGGQLAVLFSIPSLMVTLEETKGKASVLVSGVDFKSILVLLSVVIALISCTRGSLSSLKFFEL